jgi:hypothetical protein
MENQMEEEQMTAKMPWFPFYTGDFWKDEAVQLMSYEQVGMYLKILSLDWDEGSIPSDWKLVAKMLRLFGTELEAFNEMVDWITDKYDDLPENRISHRKMIEIRAHQTAVREKRIEAARMGGRSAARLRRQKAEQEERLTGLQNSTDPDPESESKEEKKEGTQPAAESPTDIWFTPQGTMIWIKEYEARMEKDYPKLNVKQELTKAKNWNLAQPPSARKKNAKKFMTNWLNREAAKAERMAKFKSTARHGTATRNNDANLERQRRLDEEEIRNQQERLQPGVELSGSGLPGSK